MKVNKVFLGGTHNESTWREKLIPKLEINYFNPIVEDWTPECQAEEYRQKELCDFLLFTITPKMTGCFSIAEVIDASNKTPSKTILCVLDEDDGATFTKEERKSLTAVENLVNKNGGYITASLDGVAGVLNNSRKLYYDINNWKELNKGIYVFNLNISYTYEIHIETWNMKFNLVTAKCSLYVVSTITDGDTQICRIAICHNVLFLDCMYAAANHSKTIKN